ncbi:unnamed protein product [Linum tenue]|uniref:ABC transmembrane type-1 domain-containing protein n=1 Tax=Linum tenue TaxID=586396 RepID=A0AAV0I3E2_9ROSI|nr:unnamed protein product [Linum tenue]
MLKVFFKENIIIAVLALLRTLAVVVLPLILYAFVSYSNLEDQNLYRGLSIVGCLVFVKLVEPLSQRHWFFLARRPGMRLRSSLMVASYEKQLKLSSLGRKRHSTGEIVNYISVDAYRMGEFPCSWLLKMRCLDDDLKNENLNIDENETPNGSVRIEDGKFSWDPEFSLPTLSLINIGIQPGHKVAVCGLVGGGKSSLLYAVLGEMPKISGTIDVSGSIAYVAQNSWIQSGTVRENVLYGKPMNQARYDEVIKACALDKDINNFPHGDLT